MKHTILFTDVDGTLIHSKNVISPTNQAAIQTMLDNNKKVVIASGRCKTMAVALSKRLSLSEKNSIYHIALNGACIVNAKTGEALYTAPIEYSLIYQLIEEALINNIHIHIYSENDVYFTEECEQMYYFDQVHDCNCIAMDNYRTDIKEQPLKVYLLSKDTSLLEHFRKKMDPIVSGSLRAEYSSEFSLEYTSVKASKGNALSYICDLYHIPIQESIAAGDAENDLTMLKAAGLSIAPSNALPIVKDTADITMDTSCEDHFIAKLIDCYFL